ncbi:hypothetical protein LTR91_000012 [Friedmanniomyces endolithicus]|uniref:ORC6 first cyclin-like domain-containing protein n=1 Tax=Friedmanniomyces endolithicus TaxID=329885 RepID=A0AAN6FMI7_9PEZI|nr:hypothetical protein LTR35_001437 [Friedmanniomyces endolithicus]KAK0297923.1 hypothetical protein LTS00_003461 [Friedmanniomyces endolithicus]KAK0319880.1 hypothetical protein LTR82_009216 [Friedmanniomyces endolithicus]KAK0921501.1 hypothetical protein LTR57_008743 [Friedmanniomyces endolithicus]KAK0999749.1 hypothetical protein LTS01_005156 [Friedmanniomyces endolithicus]
MSAQQVNSSLSSLLPTLFPLPTSLTDLATSLVAQSRARASTFKPEEEIARTYACCHIACERLGKKLGLEVGKPAPPCPPRVYGKLKTYLGSVLRTPTTPRSATRLVDRTGSGQNGAGGALAVTEPRGSGRGLRGTPSKRPAPAGEETPSKRVKKSTVAAVDTMEVEEKPRPNSLAARSDLHADREEVEGIGMDEDNFDDEPTPVKRPAKTPLRRKEKHAKRDDGFAGEEDTGAAGLLPGLGTMFQPAVDWLSEERRAEYKIWEKSVYREMATIQRQQAV